MRFVILQLRGVGPQDAKTLERFGLYYTEELLSMDVETISRKTKIPAEKLQAWKDYVVLMKIPFVGPNYANLLHRTDVGITNIKELAKAQPEALLLKLIESNKKHRLVKIIPTIKKIQRWIDVAKTIHPEEKIAPPISS